jgi:hypothetical protein
MLQEGETTLRGQIWRSGKFLVTSREGHLPERCVHCNTTTTLSRVKRRLYWHHPAIYLTIFVGLLIYVILALVLRKNAQVEFSVCQAHVARRRWRILIAWLLVLAMPATAFVLGTYSIDNALWILPPLWLASGPGLWTATALASAALFVVSLVRERLRSRRA